MNRSKRVTYNAFGEILYCDDVAAAKPQLPPKNPEVQRALFLQYVQETIIKYVDPLIAVLKLRFPEYKWEYYQSMKEESSDDYLNDGNTQCPGTKYHQYIMIPINREMRYHYEENPWWYETQDIYHGSSHEMIYFCFDKQYRDFDNRTRNSDYNALCVATFNFDRLNQKAQRLYYSPHGMSLCPVVLTKLIGLVEQTLKDQAIFNWLKKLDPRDEHFNKMVGNTD